MIRIKRTAFPADITDMIGLLTSDKWDILLYSTTNVQTELVETYLGMKSFKISHPLGEVMEGQIISRVVHGERDIFNFMLVYELPVWILLLFSIILISFTFSLADKSFSKFFSNLWKYSYLILSEPIPKLPKSSIKRAVLASWCLALTVLLAAHSGIIKNIFIKNIANKVVDS